MIQRGTYNNGSIKMKSTSVAALVAGVLSTSADALAIRDSKTALSGIVAMDVQRRHVADPVKRDSIRRRSGSVEASLDNEVGGIL